MRFDLRHFKPTLLGEQRGSGILILFRTIKVENIIIFLNILHCIVLETYELKIFNLNNSKMLFKQKTTRNILAWIHHHFNDHINYWLKFQTNIIILIFLRVCLRFYVGVLLCVKRTCCLTEKWKYFPKRKFTHTCHFFHMSKVIYIWWR